MKKRLTTVSDVISALGGPKAASLWAGVGESAICNWISRGFVPVGWHFRLHQALHPKGYELTAEVFKSDVIRQSKTSRYLERSV